MQVLELVEPWFLVELRELVELELVELCKLVELGFLVELFDLVEPKLMGLFDLVELDLVELVELRDLRINSLTSSAACFLSMGYLLSISGTV